MPAGYYEVPGLPYPRRPDTNYRGRTFAQQAHSELVAPQEGPPDEAAIRDYGDEPVVGAQPSRDPAMRSDAGMSAMSPRDPYMASLPPAPPKQPMAPAVTVLQPGRRSAFSAADAQALRALDPRSLQEANDIAAMPESTPAKMTATFGGKSFEMQPSARVDRNVLARLYAQGMERRGQERQDAVRTQVQTGNERLATIPGESAANLAKIQNEGKIGAIKAEGEVQAPTRQANIAKSNAEIAAMQGKEAREQGTFDRANDPKERQRKDARDAAERLRKSGFDKTPEGRKTLAALDALAMTNLPPEVAQSAAAAGTAENPQEALDAIQGFAADPEAARLIADIQKNKQGVFSSNERWQKKNAAQRALDSYIKQYAAAKGVDAAALRAQIESQLIGSDKGATMAMPFGLGG